MTAKRKLWLTGEAQGGPFEVFETAEDIVEDGIRCKGFFATVVGRHDEISVSSQQGPSMIKQSLFHELLHKAFGTISGDLREYILGDKTPEGRATREELIVSFLEPVLFDLLARNGWLNIPDPPSVGAKRRRRKRAGK